MKKLLIKLLIIRVLDQLGLEWVFLYGLGILHKEIIDGLPSFCPISSAIGAPTYKVAKFLLPFLTLLTENECTIT